MLDGRDIYTFIPYPDMLAIYYTTLDIGERGGEIQWMGFPMWNKCGVMSRTCQKTLAT
jgi:hypothetical protein